MDTHFSYINLIIKVFVEDGNDIISKEIIAQILSFHEGIAETTANLLDSANFPPTAILKNFKLTGLVLALRMKFAGLNASLRFINRQK